MLIRETLKKCVCIEKIIKQILFHFPNTATARVLVDSFLVFTFCIRKGLIVSCFFPLMLFHETQLQDWPLETKFPVAV